MKTIHIYIIAILLLLTAGTVYSREIPRTDGSIIIRSLQMEEKEGTLQLTFDVAVNEQAMNFRQSWSLIPELKSLDDKYSTVFPTLLINGRQKERHYNRKIQFKNIELLDNLPIGKTHIVKHTDTTLMYVVQIPYEEWMDNSQLQINQILTSSREKKQLFVITGCGYIQKPVEIPPTPPITPPEPEITFQQQSIKAFARISYPVGDSRIHPGYRNNPRELKNIEEEFLKIRQNPEAEIINIQITGYASPEGSLSLNERLSQERVEAFKNYLVTTQGIPAEKIQTSGIAEDWEGLRILINEKNIPGKEAIMAIIDNQDSPDEKEKKLRRHPQWQTLVREVFPELRRTEYQIDIIVKQISTTTP